MFRTETKKPSEHRILSTSVFDKPGTKKTKKKPIDELVGKVHPMDCISVMQSMRAGSVQMIFADPPFNLNKKYKTYKDKIAFDDYMEWTASWIKECVRILKKDGSFFLYNIPRLLIHTTPILSGELDFRHWIAWNSNGKPLGKTLQPAHYGILFYTKNGRSKFYDVRTPHARCRKCQEFLKDYGGKKHLRHEFGYQVSDVWNDIHRSRHKCNRIDGHPCQLPVHLIERMILMTTDENDIVFDPFAGGGSAAIASKQMGRRYIGCDIDREYAEAGTARYENAKDMKNLYDKYVSLHLGRIVSVRDIDL